MRQRKKVNPVKVATATGKKIDYTNAPKSIDQKIREARAMLGLNNNLYRFKLALEQAERYTRCKNLH